MYADQKFLSSWGVAIFSLLLLINYDYFPNFWWREFIVFELSLALVGMMIFWRSQLPSVAFYRWGLLQLSSIFLAYSAFSLLGVGGIVGNAWLWVIIPIWVALTVWLFRSWLPLQDGVSSANTRLVSSAVALGTALSGVLIAVFSKKVVLFAVVMTLNLLLSFTLACAVLVWLRHYLKIVGRRSH